LKWLLAAVFGLFALLVVNSVYLSSITFLEWKSGITLQGQFYLWNFLAHLVLGFAIIIPTIIFGALHWRNVSSRPNPRAIAAGIATFVASIVLLLTGVALTRVELMGSTIGIREPALRELVYWAHVIAPLAAVWLFVVHRLSGRRIKWAIGVRWSAVAVVASIAAVGFHLMTPAAALVLPTEGNQYFEPSLSKTSTGGFIPAKGMMANEYCLECHQDVVHSWAHSAHASSSFNNPLYTASVRETRKQAFEREGSVHDARFCAGCHDPVPFFSGAFELTKWDDPNYDIANDPLGRASITCTVCHGIVSIDSPRGNGDYTIEQCIDRMSSVGRVTKCSCLKRSMITSGCAGKITTTRSCIQVEVVTECSVGTTHPRPRRLATLVTCRRSRAMISPRVIVMEAVCARCSRMSLPARTRRCLL
jgi:hypothetical protein